MKYRLANPSDPYTFEADDDETAALTVFMLSTAYGANIESGEVRVPIFILGGAEEWYKEKFGRNVEEGIIAKRKQVAAALNSMTLGNFEDRRRYEAALSAITEPDKKAEFIAKWYDGRSSLNDIGTRCHEIAEALLKQEGQNEERN